MDPNQIAPPPGFVVDVEPPPGFVVDAAIPDEMAVAHRQQPPPPQQKPRPGDVLRKTTRMLSPYYRPALEGLGAAGGATAGIPGGPFTSVAGGSLGYAMGKRAADTLDEYAGLRDEQPLADLLMDTGRDLRTGAALEMGGAAAGTVLIPVMRGGKWAFDKVTDGVRGLFSKSALQESAGRQLMAHTSEGTIYARNAAEAASIEKEMPGMKFTMGQRTNDPGLIKLERAQIRKPGDAAAMNAEQIAANNEAMRAYYEKNFPGARIDATMVELSRQQAAAADAATTATGEVTRQLGDLPATPPQDTGRRIADTLSAARQPVKSAMDTLEEAIPDYPMTFTNTDRAIATAMSSKKLSLSQRRAIQGAQKDMDDLLQKGQSTHAAVGLRRTLNEKIKRLQSKPGLAPAARQLTAIREAVDADLDAVSAMAKSGRISELDGRVIDPEQLSAELERNLQAVAQMKNSVEKPDTAAMITAMRDDGYTPMQQRSEGTAAFEQRLQNEYTRMTGQPVPMKKDAITEAKIAQLVDRQDQIKNQLSQIQPGRDVAAAMDAFNNFARTEYFNRFSGSANRALSATGTPSETIPVMFTTPTGADELIRAVGIDEAGQIMKGHYAYDLLQRTTDDTGVVKPLQLKIWIKKNTPTLDKYGIRDTFDGIAAAQRVADDATTAAAAFEHGAVSRMLKADPEKAISAAITGSSTAAAARDLLQQVSGNPVAVTGLKNAFGDHIMDQVRTTAKDIAGNPTLSNAAFVRLMNKYRPAMRVLYKDDPGKLRALETMQRAYEIATRNTRSPIGSGSDTMELFTALANINVLSRSASIAKGVYKTIAKHGQAATDDLITRALFDPDVAEALTTATLRKTPAKDAERIINNQIVKLDAHRQAMFTRNAAGLGGATIGATHPSERKQP